MKQLLGFALRECLEECCELQFHHTMSGGGTPPHRHHDLIKVSTRVDRPSLADSKNRPNPISSQENKPSYNFDMIWTDRQRRDSEKCKVRHSVDRPTTSRLGKKQSQAFSRQTDNVQTRKEAKSGIQSTDRQRRDSDKQAKSGIQSTDRQRRDSDKKKSGIFCESPGRYTPTQGPQGPSGTPTNTTIGHSDR